MQCRAQPAHLQPWVAAVHEAVPVVPLVVAVLRDGARALPAWLLVGLGIPCQLLARRLGLAIRVCAQGCGYAGRLEGAVQLRVPALRLLRDRLAGLCLRLRRRTAVAVCRVRGAAQAGGRLCTPLPTGHRQARLLHLARCGRTAGVRGRARG